jgi:hypothetical protein
VLPAQHQERRPQLQGQGLPRIKDPLFQVRPQQNGQAVQEGAAVQSRRLFQLTAGGCRTHQHGVAGQGRFHAAALLVQRPRQRPQMHQMLREAVHGVGGLGPK